MAPPEAPPLADMPPDAVVAPPEAPPLAVMPPEAITTGLSIATETSGRVAAGASGAKSGVAGDKSGDMKVASGVLTSTAASGGLLAPPVAGVPPVPGLPPKARTPPEAGVPPVAGLPPEAGVPPVLAGASTGRSGEASGLGGIEPPVPGAPPLPPPVLLAPPVLLSTSTARSAGASRFGPIEPPEPPEAEASELLTPPSTGMRLLCESTWLGSAQVFEVVQVCPVGQSRLAWH